MSKSIKVAIVGVGNCASSLVQGKFYYSNPINKPIGLMHEKFGEYKISDIEFAAAFDVDERKVGKDLSQAAFAEPNNTAKFSEIPELGIVVQKGNPLDGVAYHMSDSFKVNPNQKPVDVVKVLKESKADILINYCPVGSFQASRFYAQCAVEAKVGFINAIPEFICTDSVWQEKFKSSGVPCAGDDIKSQVGATIIHRVLMNLIGDRGQKVDQTYQLNFGGNTDFQNMLDRNRLGSKEKSKTQAVTSQANYPFEVKIGPSDYVYYLKDRKYCYINIKGRQFGDVPFEIELKLNVEDSPNSGGVMVDAIRAMKLAIDNGISGYLDDISSWSFKSPAIQKPDWKAKEDLEKWIKKLSGNV